MRVVQLGCDEAVVAAAGQAEFVDVGFATLAPVLGGVVDLTPVPGGGAPGPGTPAIPRVQHDALVGGGDAFGPAQVQRAAGDPVEQRQIMIGVAGHPDQVGHCGSVPPPVTACPHPDSNSCRVVDTITVTGNPLS
jgi:hypothetical protein